MLRAMEGLGGPNFLPQLGLRLATETFEHKTLFRPRYSLRCGECPGVLLGLMPER